jgi:hypothetical protein
MITYLDKKNNLPKPDPQMMPTFGTNFIFFFKYLAIVSISSKVYLQQNFGNLYVQYV